MFNTDDERFGGSGITNGDNINSSGPEMHGCDQSISLNLPPMSVMYFKCIKKKPPRKKKAPKDVKKEEAEKKPAENEKTEDVKTEADIKTESQDKKAAEDNNKKEE